MEITKNLTYGSSVKFILNTNDEKHIEIFARVLCNSNNDSNIYSCITPHGSIVKVHYNNIHILTDDKDFQSLKKLEEDSLHNINLIYNNFFKN
jgi:hypothetical protein